MSKKQLMLFRDGNLAFFVDGKQVPAVQRTAWIQLVFAHLEKCGYDPREIDEILMPDGERIEAVKTTNGNWNWKFLED